MSLEYMYNSEHVFFFREKAIAMAPTRWGIVSAGKIASDFTTALLPAENHQVGLLSCNDVRFMILQGAPPSSFFFLHVCMYVCMYVCMVVWLYGWLYGCMDGRMNGCNHGWM